MKDKDREQRTLIYPAHLKYLRVPELEKTTRDQLQKLTSPSTQTLWTRQDLEILSSGKVSSVLGNLFIQQDQYVRQVRMPEPPLLLADRVMKISGEAGSMSKGTIWTETDVVKDAWYLCDGRMPAGIMIEAGQADLLLISWMGIDFYNKGERVYRLLGADITFHGELPKVGETLCYEIHLDGIAKYGDIRLMFFHYTCHVNNQLRMSMRNGQAGFFSDQELAESAGVLWTPETADYKSDVRVDPPKIICQYNHFSPQQIKLFSEGNTFGCFGAGFEMAQTHNYSPRIQSGKMCFIHEVTHFDWKGGPAKRGYMRAVQKVNADDWFFKGHFKNDPCMPGTLMAEAGEQVLAFYLAALGYTIDKDGWRFEPALNVESQLRCRGQCVPTSKEVVYEIFVNEFIAEPYPTLFVDLIGCVDGHKALHAHNFSVRLVPDWPLTRYPELIDQYQPKKTAAQIDGMVFDYPCLLACAWGKPSEGFSFYAPFDKKSAVPRLPGPPYHCMTRILEISGNMGGMIKTQTAQIGDEIITEYDVPADAWYFRENTNRSIPFSVLLEIALQPCGWISSFIGSVFTSKKRLRYRNLDGTGVLKKEVFPSMSCLRTHAKLTRNFASQGMIIQSFHSTIYHENDVIYDTETTFGFFPDDAFENQSGLPTSEEQRNLLTESSSFVVDLTKQPAPFFNGKLRLANPMLLMIDRITGFWPEGGAKKLGQLRAEKDVVASEWFFKAHFLQDPVQPGSLGIEAIIQLLQFYMLQQNLAAGMTNPRFESIASNKSLIWKYRGQVVPTNKLITITMEIIEIGRDEKGVFAVAEASLWVDGKRIYEVHHLTARIVSTGQEETTL